jgi:hypothetical protein
VFRVKRYAHPKRRARRKISPQAARAASSLRGWLLRYETEYAKLCTRKRPTQKVVARLLELRQKIRTAKQKLQAISRKRPAEAPRKRVPKRKPSRRKVRAKPKGKKPVRKPKLPPKRKRKPSRKPVAAAKKPVRKKPPPPPATQIRFQEQVNRFEQMVRRAIEEEEAPTFEERREQMDSREFTGIVENIPIEDILSEALIPDILDALEEADPGVEAIRSAAFYFSALSDRILGYNARTIVFANEPLAFQVQGVDSTGIYLRKADMIEASASLLRKLTSERTALIFLHYVKLRVYRKKSDEDVRAWIRSKRKKS